MHWFVAVQATPAPRRPPQYLAPDGSAVHELPMQSPSPTHAVPSRRFATVPHTLTPPAEVDAALQQLAVHCPTVPQGAPSIWQRVISRRLPVTS